MWALVRILWIIVLLLPWLRLEVHAEEGTAATLTNEVIGAARAEPGQTIRFRVRISGGVPGGAMTIYAQLGSNLFFVESLAFKETCLISPLPVENLPKADPKAPAENRLVCSVVPDPRGDASLILEVRSRLVGPTSYATARNVVAIADPSTYGIGATAAAQVELNDEPR
jgi:hypothetical protein